MKIFRIRTYNAIADFVQKVVQSIALILAGIWVVFSFFNYQEKSEKLQEQSANLDVLSKQAQINLQRQEFQYTSQHKADSDCNISIKLVRKFDSKRNYYLLGVDEDITNNTERPINFCYFLLNIYFGEDVSNGAGGYIQEPGYNIWESGALTWKRYRAFYETRKAFEEYPKRELKNDTNCVRKLCADNSFIPSKQHRHCSAKFLIIAKPSDWVGVYAYCALDLNDSVNQDFIFESDVKNVGMEDGGSKEPKKP